MILLVDSKGPDQMVHLCSLMTAQSDLGLHCQFMDRRLIFAWWGLNDV